MTFLYLLKRWSCLFQCIRLCSFNSMCIVNCIVHVRYNLNVDISRSLVYKEETYRSYGINIKKSIKKRNFFGYKKLYHINITFYFIIQCWYGLIYWVSTYVRFTFWKMATQNVQTIQVNRNLSKHRWCNF